MMEHAIEHTVEWFGTDGFLPDGHCCPRHPDCRPGAPASAATAILSPVAAVLLRPLIPRAMKLSGAQPDETKS